MGKVRVPGRRRKGRRSKSALLATEPDADTTPALTVTLVCAQPAAHTAPHALSNLGVCNNAMAWVDSFRVPAWWVVLVARSAVVVCVSARRWAKMRRQARAQGGDGSPCVCLRILYHFVRSWLYRAKCPISVQRKRFLALSRSCRPDHTVGKVRTRTVTNSDGVVVVVFTPGRMQSDGVVYFVHGGGFVMGSPSEDYLLVLRSLCWECQCVVVAVQYPLAPESRFPFALDACIEGYKWVVNEKKPKAGVVVMGDGAGAHLALMALVVLRDRIARGEESVAMPVGVYALSPVNLGKNPPNLGRCASDYHCLSCVQFMRNHYFPLDLPSHCESYAPYFRHALTDLDLRGLPFVTIVSSTDDFFLHDALDIAVHIEVGEGHPGPLSRQHQQKQGEGEGGKEGGGEEGGEGNGEGGEEEAQRVMDDTHVQVVVWRNVPSGFFLLPLFAPQTPQFFKWVAQRVACDLNFVREGSAQGEEGEARVLCVPRAFQRDDAKGLWFCVGSPPREFPLRSSVVGVGVVG